MMNSSGIPQIFLRLALGVGFLLPVMDRLGVLGEPGATDVVWGNMENFVNYTQSLMPFFGRGLANSLGWVATIAEVIFGVCLILGFKTKQIAMGSAILTFTFGIFMIFSLGIYAPFKYPVFVFTGGGLLLSSISYYKWSVDAAMLSK